MQHSTFNVHDIGVPDEEVLATLTKQLGDPEGRKRRGARQALVEIGRPAIPYLIRALSSPSSDMRWEAARALEEIPEPEAAPALVDALLDERFGVRWLAASALAHIGRPALVPLMLALGRRPDSIWLRQGAEHVLRALHESTEPGPVRDVLDALTDIEPELSVPLRAADAWRALTGEPYFPIDPAD